MSFGTAAPMLSSRRIDSFLPSRSSLAEHVVWRSTRSRYEALANDLKHWGISPQLESPTPPFCKR
jgi:hypothetical protein